MFHTFLFENVIPWKRSGMNQESQDQECVFRMKHFHFYFIGFFKAVAKVLTK